MITTAITLHPEFTIGTVPRTLFGSFVEHLGRCVYGGIYDPGSQQADSDGFRTDVIRAVQELGVTAVRYPGGNFVSAYDWEDGVGPTDTRPRRMDLAWHTVEPNHVGTNEFISWCRKTGTEPILALNLGTRGVDAALALVEYCNAPEGTKWADLRRSHGITEPHHIRYWCLGNELDGPWQIGTKTPQAYAELARETAKAIRAIDPHLQLIVCGSSNQDMPTFGEWERVVLEHCYDQIDYVSLHEYYETPDPTTPNSLLVSGARMNEFIQGVVAIADSVRAKVKSSKRILLSFDEWNIHHPNTFGPQPDNVWREAGSPIMEGDYSSLDAVVTADLLNTLLRHCDRVRIAALAQLVNVLAPIRVIDDEVITEPTYEPFRVMSRFIGGMSLRPSVTGPTLRHRELVYDATGVAAVLNPAGTRLDVSIVNRSEQPCPIRLDWSAFPGFRPAGITILDAGAEPALEQPAIEVTDPGRGSFELPAASWAHLAFQTDLVATRHPEGR